jgi:acyl transferase domain-containing protein/aryl carrier-like protein/UDP-glucose 4-epimerase
MASDFSKMDAAIIGISCRFPGAMDQFSFWQNLKAGRSSIEEVPGARWNWRAYWGDPQTGSNKSNSKWGGFLQDVDCFDADFFSLSAREVERMDPQQRIMLELTWSCLEDAGIRPSALSGEKVGVFLGVFNFDYKELQEKHSQLSIEAHHSTGTATALIANRISYHFNFRGPSFPIDTACSSSLSAVHAAFQSLQQGECRYAIAGGINLLLTPTRHISFSQTGMLSPTGSCKAFDDHADGYVRGEGAGLLLLKPLSQAIKDNDHIYGVIRGSAVNHGGRTYTLTYPNPEAQAQVITAAQQLAGIGPDTISYIEAHGTGTPKGDPIEFQGLTGAFQAGFAAGSPERRTGYCGIGSAKTNIGHLEAAAGVAGIIKVLLSMKYRQLPGLQNFTALNHRISLADSPFFLVTHLQDWPALKDAEGHEQPRRAGVSSFGFGGTNAHVVLEEFPVPENVTEPGKVSPYYYICLSAKTADNLIQKEKDLAAWLRRVEEVDLADLCRTLSTGREHFPNRSVLTASNVPQLLDKLEALSQGRPVEGCFRNLDRQAGSQPLLPVETEVEEYLNGNEPDWERPWFGAGGRRISLPSYPFTKQSYWIPKEELQPVNGGLPEKQLYTRVFSGNESFLRDHIVQGRRVLPAVVYLEMVRAAVTEAREDLVQEPDCLCLENIVWVRPVIAGEEPVTASTHLSPVEQDPISFEVSTGHPGAGATVHCRGNARFIRNKETRTANLQSLRDRQDNRMLTRDDCYRQLTGMGLHYGPAHQGIQIIYGHAGGCLAKLALSVAAADAAEEQYLHPGLMDAAVQAALLVGDDGEKERTDGGLFLPFALERIEITGPCTGEMWAVIRTKRRSALLQADIDLCDPSGIVCVRMKGLSFKGPASSASEPVQAPAQKSPSASAAEKMAIDYFKNLLSVAIKRPASQIAAEAAMEQYGIDSIMIMEMTRRMEEVFGPLPKTLFFEYQNIRELTGYFLENHTEKINAMTEKVEQLPVPEMIPSSSPRPDSSGDGSGALDIAIIGLAGRYPQADSLEAFWTNLKMGKDCITEIPGDRWDYREYFDKDKQKEGKSYSKWGGFLNDVDKFDPLFFNISPLEAERMDPQERLFLQCVYETIEDAGYTRQSLGQKMSFGLGNLVGVFVGVMYEEYQLFGVEEALRGKPVSLWGLPSSIANRVSYFCDFHGPSMAIDTMCSSSLTAIHLACESIVRGKCELAIAGGVNVSVHPNKYLFLSQGRFASSKGRCESFGVGGDGYVPGEGVGAVLLKPLAKAISDGDHIYGVIKSTAVNHGGKTNGYTVPNLKAQAAVIGKAFEEAGIDPRAISYIEAHGTGTSLGDPVEIAGLSKALSGYTADTQFCAIGSAKSNIGHCESAAGIAGLTKVLLQMRYRMIVPSLHSETLNENIDFSKSPFVVQQTLTEWKRPVLEKKEYPLYAGISSFGAGGANAHIIVEEYRREPINGIANREAPALILLSGVDYDRLQVKVRQLLDSLGPAGRAFWKIPEEALAHLAYTLQVGREAMPARLALVVTSIDELVNKLQDFAAGEKNIEGLFHGQVSPGREAVEMPEAYMEKREYEKIAREWVNGAKPDWKRLYRDTNLYRRISLPTYPFKKDRYWVGEPESMQSGPESGNGKIASIHPLLHENISDLSGQRFSVRFSGDEFYLRDHKVNEQKILPAVAFLEMIRVAVWRSTRRFDHKMTDIRLKNINWILPVHVEAEGKLVNIELSVEENGDIFFEIHDGNPADAAAREVFCSGIATIQSLAGREIETSDISFLQKECQKQVLAGADCYELFEKAGFQYGPSLQGLERVYIGDNSILAKIKLDAAGLAYRDEFVLHPGLMDPVMQVTLLWNHTAGSSVKMHVPVSLDEVEIRQALSPEMWAVITKQHGLFDIDILNEKGERCVRLTGIAFKTPALVDRAPDLAGDRAETLLLFPAWVKRDDRENAIGREFDRHIVFVCGLGERAHRLGEALPGAEIVLVEGGDGADLIETLLPVFEKTQDLLKQKGKGDILMQALVPCTGEGTGYAALSGLFKTAEKENPRFLGQVIRVPTDYDLSALCSKVRENREFIADKDIRYNHGHREVLTWKILQNDPSQSDCGRNLYPWKEGAVYLITGGAGGLGFIFAREIAGKAPGVTLILTGRSLPDEAKLAEMDMLRQMGARVVYKRTDVTDEASVRQLIQSIQTEFGPLRGIIHSSGVIRDSFLIRKTAEEWREVLSPKVNGLRYLDVASKDIPLDFFIFFSSVAGASGNIGQADYATANAFMDEYAAYRDELVANGSRHGRTLSVNWPLWKEGGMQVGKEAEQYLLDSMGIVPLPTASGIEALYRGLSSGYSRVMVAAGDREKISDRIIRQQDRLQPKIPGAISSANIDSETGAQAIQYFTNLFSGVTKLPAGKISPEISLAEYGIDSVMVMKVTNALEKVFGALSKTLFFEYQNIRQLTRYFLEEHYSQLAAVLGIGAKSETAPERTEKKDVTLSRRKSGRFSSRAATPAGPIDIAIVGVAGRYPQADNLDEFWVNLRDGRDCVTEIPGSRWDYRLYFDSDKSKAGKTYSKWGGFINGVEHFDPLFFNISPREAELLDPQERLFLQCAYETIEDAGYSRQALALDEGNAPAGNVGVYVGVMYEEYQLFGAEEGVKGRNIALFGNPSSVANRVSFFYNFNGPSMAVDTMCSSSLTAIHLACQGIFNGDCKAAIAGGVNISIHPNKYLLLAQGKFISGKGRCESFGLGGDGYVPGEGVGAVFLKPLSQAITDGDHVYGVIKATSINHGGRTNGYTVPNPNAQAAVIRRAYQRSGIDPRTVSYLEAHGTGTSLGDPIEITGLAKCYREYTSDNGFCAIGSVKSNIGHGESAAGIAGLTKVLLQLRYKQLVPSLHSKELNPNIDFVNSPFIVQHELSAWDRPVVVRNGQAREFPRRAGLSSFGAGGSNAHLIIEEFDDTTAIMRTEEPVIIVLSAKNADKLKEVAEKLVKNLKSGLYRDTDLVDIAFTLQTGRDALEARLAMIVRTLEELVHKLTAFSNGQEAIEGVYSGMAERDNSTIEAFATDEELKEALLKWIEKRKYTKLCHFWVKGLTLDWTKLYVAPAFSRLPRRLSLPAYPFAKERYWVPRGEGTAPQGNGDKKAEVLLLKPEWKYKDIVTGSRVYSHHLILFINLPLGREHEDVVRKRIGDARVVHLVDPGTGLAEGFQENALAVLSELQDLLRGNSTGEVLVQVVVPDGNEVLPGIHALLKTARLEDPRITGQLIQTEEGIKGEDLAALLGDNSHGEDAHIRYILGRRQVVSLGEYEHFAGGEGIDMPGFWKEGGVYLITGGAGAIGLAFAREIVRHAGDVTIILTGRSALTADRLEGIRSLAAGGKARVEYRRADTSNRSLVGELIESIQRDFGSLNGIIYSAGVTRDNFLLRTTRQDWQEVFAPKVAGLVNLDEATSGIGLDLFIVFSSVAGIFGNPGQANYATANAFMDGYVRYRNKMAAIGERTGATISISWPLWKEGGMRVYKEVEEEMEEKMGIVPIGTHVAIEAFYHAAASGLDRLTVVYGDRSKLHERLLGVEGRIHKGEGVASKEDALWQLKTLFGQVVKLPPEKIDEKEEFRAYGLNSVMVIQLNQMLEKIFGRLSKTLFYEHQNLLSLTEYLVKHHGTALGQMGQTDKIMDTDNAGKKSKAADRQEVREKSGGLREPVAIIGMSGRYPMAGSLRTYWDNLKNGKDCISEIPADRWDLEDFFLPDREKAMETGKSYSKWGGFLEGFADFDPLFFNISPGEAVTMDPQERLFLQACWEVLEDAGYTKQEIARNYNHNVGVFAGVTKTGFELYNTEFHRQGEEGMLRTSFSSVANRVSYHLNLCGPSMPVDTMCSSSLTAIHEACENLHRGTCEMAIAGGVNLYLHPSNYTALCSQGFLSSDGKCRSFGDGGSGFVPGEGVGAVLLKPLSRAIADGDDIYAVIRGTSVNHGGKTSGYTVPNPIAQAQLIRTALDKAGVSAREISYIEAHGTGTSLGDPIEITGLSQAFGKDTADVQFCAIGSVKSNIGHLEAAAGIAGVAKIVLQMKHRMLAPSLHAGELNKNIDFERSPFYVQRELSAWDTPVVEENGMKRELPRLASISAFGAGGANAHVIIGEYIPDAGSEKPTEPENLHKETAAFIVLSARNEKQLMEKARQLLAFIDEEITDNRHELLRMAYTLQTGREEMEERLGFRAASVEELREKLRSLSMGKGDDREAGLLTDWVRGGTIEWSRLYTGGINGAKDPKRMHLPVYPFERTKYWLPGVAAERKSARPVAAKKWIFTGERWVIKPFAEDIDWTARLRQQAGKRICIVYSTEEDRRELSILLERLTKAAGLNSPEVGVLHVSQVTVEAFKKDPPDVVMLFGPQKGTNPSVQFVENDIFQVYTLSKCLMQAAWEKFIRIYYIFETGESDQRLDCEALSGFFRSAVRENEQHVWTSIRLDDTSGALSKMQVLLREWLSDEPGALHPGICVEVRHLHDHRHVKELVEIRPDISSASSSVPVFRNGGTYIVAGGMGYIGRMLLEQLAGKYKATLVVLSRSDPDAPGKEQCRKLEMMGAKVYYQVVDVTDLMALRQVYQKIKQEAGDIHGVINLTRAHESRSIAGKDWGSFLRVSRVKIMSTLNLDEVTRDEHLDVFMTFCSMGAYGARGDSDYAFSVAFQNAFVRYRDRSQKEGARQGMAISFCWGPWEGGKSFFGSGEDRRPAGIDGIDMRSAFSLIEAARQYTDPVIGICAVLDEDKARETLALGSPDQHPMQDPAAARIGMSIGQWEQESGMGRPITIDDILRVISMEEVKRLDIALVERIYKLCFEGDATRSAGLDASEKDGRGNRNDLPDSLNAVREILMQVLQIENIDEGRTLQSYGLDSIIAVRASARLEKRLKCEVRPGWLIEYPTVKELAGYLNGLLQLSST